MSGAGGMGMGSTNSGDRQTGSGFREKRTFKDKLHFMIQEAEAAELQARRDAQSLDKKNISISLLMDGRPQAYSDFFNLTHARNPNPKASGTSPDPLSGSTVEEIPQDSLVLIKDHLMHAERATRAGNMLEVYEAYKALAKYFAQTWKLPRAEHFFKKCLAIAQDGDWLEGELEANLALGVVYEELKDIPSAIACHERRVLLSSQLAAEGSVSVAYAEGTEGAITSPYAALTAVYLRQAQSQEASADAKAAIQSYNKCLEAAGASRDSGSAAKAHFRLGHIYAGQEKWLEAMHFLKKFIDADAPTDDRASIGTAATTYAACQIEIGDEDGAVLSLENYLSSGTGLGNMLGPAIACCSLGNLYYSQGKVQQSVMYLEKFFEMSRSLSDRRMVEVARTNLGIARGTLKLNQFMGVVVADLPKLISWKNARVPFGES